MHPWWQCKSGSGVRADPDRGPVARSDASVAAPDDGWSHDELLPHALNRCHDRPVGPAPPHPGGASRSPSCSRSPPSSPVGSDNESDSSLTVDQGQLRLRPAPSMQVGSYAGMLLVRADGASSASPLRARSARAVAAWTADVAMLGFTVVGLTIAGWAVSGLAMWHAVDQGEDAVHPHAQLHRHRELPAAHDGDDLRLHRDRCRGAGVGYAAAVAGHRLDRPRLPGARSVPSASSRRCCCRSGPSPSRCGSGWARRAPAAS